MRSEFGIGIEDYERLSAVGASSAMSSISPTNPEKAAEAVAVLLTFAEGVDAETILTDNTPGVTSEDTGNGYTLYRIPDVKGLTARVVDGRHVLLTAYENQLDPPGSKSAKSHVKAVSKSDQSLAISGVIPTTKFSGPMADSAPTMPQSFTLGVDLPAGVDIALGLDFADKDDAEKMGEMWEQMQGMAYAAMGTDTKGEVGKAVLSRLRMERDGSTQMITINFSEGDLELMAEETVTPAIAEATNNPLFRGLVAGLKPPVSPEVGKAMRDAKNIVSIYSAAVAAESPELAGVSDAESGARKIVQGVRGGAESGFDTTSFRASLSDEELGLAMKYIVWDTERNALRYQDPPQ
jgi:hypothetical protein